MRNEIRHSCGHTQQHFIVGGAFAADAEREARRLARRTCTACYRAGKQAGAAAQAAVDRETLNAVQLPPLAGSERQVAWAEAIRLERLAALYRARPDAIDAVACRTDAKWWIDNRTLDLATGLPA